MQKRKRFTKEYLREAIQIILKQAASGSGIYPNVLRAPLKTEDFFLRARSGARKTAVSGRIHEDLSTRLTPPSGKRTGLRDALKLVTSRTVRGEH